MSGTSFPILISSKHSQQGLNQTKSNRMEEFGDPSKGTTVPPVQGFQYWKPKTDWQQKAILIQNTTIGTNLPNSAMNFQIRSKNSREIFIQMYEVTM